MDLAVEKTFVDVTEVSLDFPIFNASSRSLKSQLLNIATGGFLRHTGRDFVEVRALSEISLSLQEGDRLAIFGHNGAGKSSFLRLVAGIYEPTLGTVKSSGSLGSLIDVGLGMNPESTGRENIYLRGALMGLNKKAIKDVEKNVIEFSELGEFIDLPVRTYSTGMQMRLAFAVSTVIEPDILLMDEWLSVGDEKFKSRAESRINAMVEKTKILILATHSSELALRTCNRAIWLEHGRMKMQGPVSAVCESYFA